MPRIALEILSYFSIFVDMLGHQIKSIKKEVLHAFQTCALTLLSQNNVLHAQYRTIFLFLIRALRNTIFIVHYFDFQPAYKQKTRSEDRVLRNEYSVKNYLPAASAAIFLRSMTFATASARPPSEVSL